MAWSVSGNTIVEAASTALSGGAMVQLLNWWIAKRKASQIEGVDLRRVVAEEVQALIRNLSAQHAECREELGKMDRRMEVFERMLPILRVRDAMMERAIREGGLQMPPMPPVEWPP